MAADLRLEGTRVEAIEAQPTVAVRVQRQMGELNLRADFDRFLPLLARRIAELGVAIAGAPYGRYHRFGPDVADVEIGYPVSEPASGVPALGPVEAGAVGASELPGGLVARTTHLGPYSNLGRAFDTLHEWIHAQPGVDDGDGPWESYVDSPREVKDVSALRTEIVWPLRETGSQAPPEAGSGS